MRVYTTQCSILPVQKTARGGHSRERAADRSFVVPISRSSIFNPLSSVPLSAIPALRHYQSDVVVLLARAELPNVFNN